MFIIDPSGANVESCGMSIFTIRRIVIAVIELIQKLKKGQYGVPYSFGDSSLDIWTTYGPETGSC